jgi:cyclopropane-fatty-acyl-phospholipid synthase
MNARNESATFTQADSTSQLRASLTNDLPSLRTHADWTHGRPSMAERTVLSLLKRLEVGHLSLHRGSGRTQGFGSPTATLRADIHVHDDAVFKRVMQHGDIGLAEGYIDGQWDTHDLTSLLALMMQNREVLDRAIYGSALRSWFYKLRHLLRRNSERGSRRNIQAHYDLGNDFYRLWLDESWTYSSAWFNGDLTQSLTDAQWAKIDRALDEAAVGRERRVLEVGCGWGTLAKRAAARGAHVTGITLSDEQLAWGQQRTNELGLEDRVSLKLLDYRRVGTEPGFKPFDAIVSIEMFEAVGRSYWSSYFDMLKRCLAQDGKACIQSIVIRDDLFERYAKSTDFIQQYVFPGGMLPSTQVFVAEAAKAGLKVERTLHFGRDYGHTLKLWREAFHANDPSIRALGYDERFMRLWDFYLAYCEAAFATGNTDVVQFTLTHA